MVLEKIIGTLATLIRSI